MRVDAAEPWNDTGLDVEAGDGLVVAATGEWWDRQFRATAAGYEAPWYLRVWGWLRRCPRGKWFELSGAVGRSNRHAFPIGARGEVTVPASGRLFLFANDVPGFYGNNRGALDVEIGRSP